MVTTVKGTSRARRSRSTRMARLQFEIPEEQLSSLAELMRQLGVRNRSELFHYAITLLRWTVRQHLNGRSITSVDASNNTYRELEMPIFENLRDLAGAYANHGPQAMDPNTAWPATERAASNQRSRV